MTFKVYGPGFEQFPTNASSVVCGCMAPHGCRHAEEVDRLRIGFVRLAEALERIAEQDYVPEGEELLGGGEMVDIAKAALRGVSAKTTETTES